MAETGFSGLAVRYGTLRRSHELVRIAGALRRAGVRALAIKGPALAVVIGDAPDSRLSGDLDFLVPHAEVEAAGQVLRMLGFVPRPRSNGLARQIHFVRSDPPFRVDLHWHVAPAHIALPLDLERMWRERTVLTVHGRPVDTLSVVDHLFLATFYCIKEAPRVEHRYLLDVLRLASLFERTAWRRLRERAEEARAVRIVAIAVRTAFAAAGEPLPRAFAELFPEEEAVAAAVDDLLARARDPRSAIKHRIATYLAHFFHHGRYREHWRDRLRPILLLPLFLLLPEDDDVERAAASGRSPYVERLKRLSEVVAVLREARARRRADREFERALGRADTRLRPAADVELHLFADRGLLFAPHSGELCALTTSATWIWCALCEGLDLGEVRSAFARAFSLQPDEAERVIADLLRAWWRHGLLADAPRPPAKAPATPAAPAAPAAELPPPSGDGLDLELRIRDLRYGLALARPAAPGVLPFLAHWQDGGFAAARPAEWISARVDQADGEWRVVIDGQLRAATFALAQLGPEVQYALAIDAARRRGYDLWLDASMLADRDGAVLLIGSSLSDSLPLAFALARQGLERVADRWVLLAGEPLRAMGLPVSAGIGPEEWEELRRRHPEIAGGAIPRDGDGCFEAFLAPPSGERTGSEALAVRLLVFPRRREGAATVLAAVDPAEALELLLTEGLAEEVQFDAGRVERLIRWIREVPAVRLDFGDPEEAACCLLARGRSPAGTG